MFLAIALFGLHIYRNVQTINNIPNDFTTSTKATNITLSINNEEGPKIQPTSCDPQNFIVLIKAGSKSKYQQRRKIWRDSTCPSSYKQYGLNYHFMLAMPAHEIIDPNGHNQGKRASDEEIKDMKMLQNESIVHKDMIFLPLKDVYDDSNLKVISMIRWAVDRGMTDKTSVVVIHDDEYCLRPEVLQTVCEDTVRSNSSLYAGDYLWEKAYYEMQKGFDGSFAPYFSGHLYALSSDLVRDIAYSPDTLFASQNMGYAEDLQVGKWVQNQANREDNPRQIKSVTERSLLWSVGEDKEDKEDEPKDTETEEHHTVTGTSGKEEVSCGNHRASSCAECPRGNGAVWCNGECKWTVSKDGGVCQSKTSKDEAMPASEEALYSETNVPKGENEDDGVNFSDDSWSIPRNLILVYSGQNFLSYDIKDAAKMNWPKGEYYLAQNVRRMISMNKAYNVEFFDGDRCRSLIPELEVSLSLESSLKRIWNVKRVLKLYNDLPPQYQSDFCRIMALWKLGGVYVDNDTFFVKTDFFRFFNKNTTFFTSATSYDKDFMLCGFVGGTAKNELIRIWLELTLIAYVDEKNGTQILNKRLSTDGIEVNLAGSAACKLLNLVVKNEHILLEPHNSTAGRQMNIKTTIWLEERFDRELGLGLGWEHNPFAIGPSSMSPSGPMRDVLVAFTRQNNVLDAQNRAISESGMKKILDQYKFIDGSL